MYVYIYIYIRIYIYVIYAFGFGMIWFKVIWGKLKWLHIMPYDLIPLDIMYALTCQKWNPNTDQQTSSDWGSALLQAITDEAKPTLCSRSFSQPNHWLSTSIFTSILVYPGEYIYLIHINRLGHQHRRLKINPSLWSSSSAIRGPMKPGVSISVFVWMVNSRVGSPLLSCVNSHGSSNMIRVNST